MIGDVNLFVKEEREVECEIMIAEKEYRRQGCAIEALRMMLQYATSAMHSSPISPLPVSPDSLIARIGISNAPSISLFRKLGFEICKHVEVFEEVEMRFAFDPETGSCQNGRELMSLWNATKLEVLEFE